MFKVLKEYTLPIRTFSNTTSLVSKNYIGPPDKLSNLRPILRFEREHETSLQKKLRLRHEEVQKWNQMFWQNHNKQFFEDKASFIKLKKNNKDDTLSADEMSEFYKYFLDKNWKLHFKYNMLWYSKNIELLCLDAQESILSGFRKIIGKFVSSK